MPSASTPGGGRPDRHHDHDWRLRAVRHEDGLSTEEYGCADCGETTFR